MDVQGVRPALGDAARFAVVEAVGTDVQQLAGDGRAVVDVVAGTQVQRPPGKQLAAVVDVVARTKAQAVAGADLSAVDDVFARIKADAVVGADVAAVVDAAACLQAEAVVARDAAATVVDLSGADAERVNPVNLSAVVVNLSFDPDGFGAVEVEPAAGVVQPRRLDVGVFKGAVAVTVVQFAALQGEAVDGNAAVVLVVLAGKVNFATAGDAATVLDFTGDFNPSGGAFVLAVVVVCGLGFCGSFFCLPLLQARAIMVGKALAADGERLVAVVVQAAVVFETCGFDIEPVGGNLAL